MINKFFKTVQFHTIDALLFWFPFLARRAARQRAEQQRRNAERFLQEMGVLGFSHRFVADSDHGHRKLLMEKRLKVVIIKREH
jgi:hypothetical protein